MPLRPPLAVLFSRGGNCDATRGVHWGRGEGGTACATELAYVRGPPRWALRVKLI